VIAVRGDGVEPITQRDRRGIGVGDLIPLPGGRVGVVKRIDRNTRELFAEPIPHATVAGVDKAISSFRRFSGHVPEGVLILPELKQPGVAWMLGELESVVYRTVRDGRKERYLHKFKDRPALGVSFDGLQLVILGGGYRVTERGIEG
jgi:hypothetical protein